MSEMESLSKLLHRTIKEGVPLFNGGRKKECFDLYLDTAKYASAQEALKDTPVGQLLSVAVAEASELGQAQEWSEGAWVLRHCFDDILDRDEHQAARGFLLFPSTNDEGSSDSYWQDEEMKSSSDIERGQAIADIAYILRASITPTSHTRYTKSYDDCFPASEAVEVLTTLGLAANRAKAVKKCNLLLKGSFIIPVSHSQDASFKDGTHLYRFPDLEELQAALAKIQKEDKDSSGTDSAILTVALQNTLEVLPGIKEGDSEQTTFAGISSRHLHPRRFSSTSAEQLAGEKSALLCASVEKIVAIQDRRYGLKTYNKCFVGKEAVSDMVKEGIAGNRVQAVTAMNELINVGLIQHVTHDHIFKDKALFYRFTPVKDIKQALDVTAALPMAPSGLDLVRYHAFVHRYKKFAGLDITAILKSFYGCDTEEGFDLVDLQNWRNNMKRWGFGRREDQDDDMVEKLAPVVVNIDPETWDVTGDEKWESPYGILAQIAIFDQIPRSAFRGTADAFKWDELAIRATKVALEKGYFESAFKSTLNQFLLLLPLEHSESWEDQKLGVSLLLGLLSTVAVQDEGLSDYEIVKRLEFSKRLTRAFLEHAQIIAKFKRYPHRNRPLGRTTTLEERIFLASDLVPGWARSQQPEDARNVVRLPVIPLKRLTKG